jgi:hypothetical protein
MKVKGTKGNATLDAGSQQTRSRERISSIDYIRVAETTDSEAPRLSYCDTMTTRGNESLVVEVWLLETP